jgi:hypothetical protein
VWKSFISYISSFWGVLCILFTCEIIQPEMAAVKENTADDSDKTATTVLEGSDLNP